MRITELAKYDFPEPLIASWQSQGIEKLLPIQEQAIKRHNLFNGKSMIVSAPTSSGKTFIGEMAAVYQGLNRRKTVYLVPLKALAEEKFLQFANLYEPYGIRIAISTRDRKEFDEALSRGDFEIAIVVYEKFFQLLNTTPKFLKYIGLVVVDELQLLSDPSRGSSVELIFTKLKTLHGSFQLIGLTAVLGNNRQVNEWLDVELLHYDRRPVELRIGYLWDGVFHYRTYNSQDNGEEQLLPPVSGAAFEILEVVITSLAQKGEQSLVFVSDKEKARGLAKHLAENAALEPAEYALTELEELETTASNEELAVVLAHGTAFHHADLTAEERSLVERHFRKEQIRVLVSTTTLAMGVNLPTRNVFIELAKWQSEPGDLRPSLLPLPRADFENMAGRAGRFQLEEEFGRAMAVLTRPVERDQFRNVYLDGKLEDIKPNLWRDSMATTVLGMVALGQCTTAEEVRQFLRNTLTWHLYRKSGIDQSKLEENLEQGISECLQVGVLVEDRKGKLHITELGKAISANGIRVETGGILKDWLEQRGDSAFTATEAILSAVITPDGQEAYLNMSTPEFRQIGNYYSRTIHELLGDRLFQLIQALIGYRLDSYLTVRAFKTALLLTDYAGTMSARELEEHYHTYFGAVKRVAEHIAWVMSSSAAIANVLGMQEAWPQTLNHLANEVQHGLPPEGIRLAQMRVPRLGRERIRALLKEGAITDKDILEAGEEFISRLTTKPVAKQLFKRIRANRQRNEKAGHEVHVTQHDNQGSVVVGVNSGTIIVGGANSESQPDKIESDVEDITSLKSADWRREVLDRVGELDPEDIKGLYERARALHHNQLRPAFRDAGKSSTFADLRTALGNAETAYADLTELLKDKLVIIALPDLSKDFSSIRSNSTSLKDAQSQVDSIGKALLKRVTRLVNVLEEFRTSPEEMLLSAVEEIEDKSNAIIVDRTGLQSSDVRQEGFYRKSEVIDAFRNLVSNALDGMTSAPNPRLVLTSEVSGGQTAIRISDNGKGIVETDRDRIFEDGFSTKGSTGFGLAHAKRIFEAHGGSLRLLDGEADTTFEVIL